MGCLFVPLAESVSEALAPRRASAAAQQRVDLRSRAQQFGDALTFFVLNAPPGAQLWKFSVLRATTSSRSILSACCPASRTAAGLADVASSMCALSVYTACRVRLSQGPRPRRSS